MRITNNIIQREALSQMQNGLRDIERAQRRVSTGLRIQKASDDPAGASTSMRARSSLRALDQYRRNIEVAGARTSQEEAVLGQVTDLLTRARELGISQGGSTASDATRAVTAAEVRELIDAAVQLGNTRMGDEYLFGGNHATEAPFDATQPNFLGTHLRLAEVTPATTNPIANGVVSRAGSAADKLAQGDYEVVADALSTPPALQLWRVGDAAPLEVASYTGNGTTTFAASGLAVDTSGQASIGDFDTNVLGGGTTSRFAITEGIAFPEGQLQTEIASGRHIKVNHDGKQVFLDTGVFDSLRALADGLTDTSDPETATRNALTGLEESFTKVQSLLGEVGARSNQLEVTESNLSALEINLQTLKSDLEEVDFEKAVSELVGRQTSFQAAMLATSRVMGLTLADYLR